MASGQRNDKRRVRRFLMRPTPRDARAWRSGACESAAVLRGLNVCGVQQVAERTTRDQGGSVSLNLNCNPTCPNNVRRTNLTHSERLGV